MRLSVLLLLFIGTATKTIAQPPAGYYNSAQGLSGPALRQALHNIIDNHTELSYTPGVWNAYYTTDVKPGTNKIWSFYSDKPGSASPYQFTVGADQCSGSSPSGEGGCYNREHIWPKTYFNGQAPMYTDLWIVYPSDYWVNSKRQDFPFGRVNNATQTFQNGSKIGNNTYPGAPTTGCFEPIDSFKGDIARTMFYVATRYYGEDNGWSNWEMANGANLKTWAVSMLLEWHHNDPVSQKELLRNNAVYAIQGNRNPFIDHPEMVDCIWGGQDCSATGVSTTSFSAGAVVYPNPVRSGNDVQVTIPGPRATLSLFTVDGRCVQTMPIAGKGSLNTTGLSAGLYFLKVVAEEGAYTTRLVVD